MDNSVEDSPGEERGHDGDSPLIEEYVNLQIIPDQQNTASESPPNDLQDSPQDSPKDNVTSAKDEDQLQNDDPPQDEWVHELHTAIENNNADDVATLLDNDGALETLFVYRFDPQFDIDHGITPLMLAAGLGRESIVQLLLDRGANIFAKMKNTNATAFYTAARTGHKSIVEMLFNRGGAEILEEPHSDGRRPLGTAARAGHPHVVKFLLDKGADVNSADIGGHTPLHLASIEGTIATVKILLDHGADINASKDDSFTPLHNAAECGHLDVVKLVFKAKPETLDIQSNDKRTPLMQAALSGHVAVVDYLLARGSNINSKDIKDWTSLHLAARENHIHVVRRLLRQERNLLEMRTNENDTALTLAIYGGHTSIVDSLLSRGADTNVKDFNNWTTLHFAANNGYLHLVRRLLKQNTDLLNLQNEENDTALTLAAYRGHLAIVDTLISRGADIYVKDSDDRTAWHLSAGNGHLEIVKLLFNIDRDLLETQDSMGRTAFARAAHSGHLSVVKHLLSIGANIDVRDNDNETVINLAAESGHVDVVEFILQTNADFLDSKGFLGRTAISVALRESHPAVFDFLFDKEADIATPDDEGSAPFHAAATRGHIQIIQRMLDRNIGLLNLKGFVGRTAILEALMGGHVATFRYLLDKGADITIADEDHYTPFYIAARDGHIEVVQQLFKKRPDLLEVKGILGRTPILSSLMRGHLDIFNYLFEMGADITIADEDRYSPFYIAACDGHIEVVQQLFEKRPDLLEIRGYFGRTPILSALAAGHLEVFNFLFDKEADITVADENTDLPLHFAVSGGHLKAVERILERRPELIEKRGVFDRTPLAIALFTGHLDIFYYLFDKEADITVVDVEGNNPLHLAARDGHLKAVERILKKEADLLDSKGLDGQTALISASENGHLGVVTYLLSEGADITLKSVTERTALHWACFEGSVEICQLFLGTQARHGSHDAEKNFITARDDWDDTALIDAAEKGHVSVLFELLEAEVFFPQDPASVDPYVSYEKEIEKVETFLLGLHGEGKTDEINRRLDATIYWAILNGRTDLLSKCLSKIQNVHDLSAWERGGFSCAHIAALGGHSKMMKQLLLNGLCTLGPTQEGGISPFHLAVKYNHIELVKQFMIWLGASPAGGIPEKKRDKILVLRQVLQSEDTVLDAILRKQDDANEHTSISLAASGLNENHRELERFLWDTLDKSINDAFFQNPMRREAHLILELAAQFETPGEEKYLVKYLKLMSSPPNFDSSGFNTLHWAVHHRLPVVVWWLLSNGWYLSGNHIETAQHIVTEWEEKEKNENGKLAKNVIRDVMKGILESPPPLRKQQAWRYEENLPQFRYPPQDHNSPEGTVLDFFHEGHQASFQLKRRSMATIIYTAGPQKIMQPGQYLDLKSLKEELSGSEKLPEVTSKKRKEKALPEPRRRNDDTPATPVEKTSTAPTKSTEKDRNITEKKKTVDLRWIHIPANNLRCAEELMVRMSRDKGIKNKYHRPWAQFVRKSWVELPAGGNKFYMKPQCVVDRRYVNTPEMRDSRLERPSALYMPYLFWKKCPVESNKIDPGPVRLKPDRIAPTDTNTTGATPRAPRASAEEPVQLSQAVQSGQERRIIHEPMTLDQYYYVSLEDTSLRDKDQVLWRSTNPELKKKGSGKTDDKRRSMSHTRANRELRNAGLPENSRKDASQAETDVRKILIVNQLWLWILDENTIITRTTQEIDEGETSFLQRVLVALQAQGKTSTVSVDFLKELILSTATGLFYKREIEVLGKRKSPLDVYREAILTVRKDEARLFDEFASSLKKGNGGPEAKTTKAQRSKNLDQHDTARSENVKVTRLSGGQDSEDELEKRESTKNPYDNISEETELLREVKDISDELNMLKNLAEDQEDVWKKIWKDGQNPDAAFTYDTPSEIKAEIEEMIKEADFVQQAIDTLLDLKQKQANIVEAKYTRKQSDDTAVQGDTIMVFTVVTILFLPASFLTSLLALNISDFPHAGDNVKFQGRLILPVIFGVSIAVSGLFAIIAFNASKLKNFFFGTKGDHNSGTPAGSAASSSIDLFAERPHRPTFNPTAKRRVTQQVTSERRPEEFNARDSMGKEAQGRSSFAGSVDMV